MRLAEIADVKTLFPEEKQGWQRARAGMVFLSSQSVLRPSRRCLQRGKSDFQSVAARKSR